jgi:hypothetical protein
MRVLSCIVLATALLSAIVGCRKAELPDFVTAEEKNAMQAQRLWSKGGMGITASPNDEDRDGAIYVATRSTRNVIEWRSGEKSKEWIGRKASTPEVVVFFDDKIWPSHSLPHNFDKNKSFIFSFDEKYIRVYDFFHRQGGYFVRQDPNEEDAK